MLGVSRAFAAGSKGTLRAVSVVAVGVQTPMLGEPLKQFGSYGRPFRGGGGCIGRHVILRPPNSDPWRMS